MLKYLLQLSVQLFRLIISSPLNFVLLRDTSMFQKDKICNIMVISRKFLFIIYAYAYLFLYMVANK